MTTASEPILPVPVPVPVPVIAAARLASGASFDGARSDSRGTLFSVRRGVLSVDTVDTLWAVPPGHTLWVPPHRTPAIRAHGAFDGWWVTVAESASVDLPSAAVASRSNPLLDEAVARAATWQGGALDAVRWRLAAVVLDEIAALQPAPLGLPMPLDARLESVARNILADLSDARGLDALAASAGIASRTLSRNFAMETGLSLADWRQRARLMSALEALAAERPVATLAADLGYENVSAFIAMFKREMGVTPARFFEA